MANGPDLLRISPSWPAMVASPAEFDVWCQGTLAYDVNIHLAVTEECYNSMTTLSGVVVQFGGGTIASFNKADFTGVTTNSETVPAVGGYQVAALKDHLDEGLSEPLGANDAIYWAMKPLANAAFDPLGGSAADPEEITVILNAGETRMLVHLLGASENGGALNMRVPTTPSGFVVPEVATILLAGASFAGLGLYAIKRKRQ